MVKFRSKQGKTIITNKQKEKEKKECILKFNYKLSAFSEIQWTMEEVKPSAANLSPLTPLGFLERAAIAYNDCPSIIYDNITYTWSQTLHRCLQLASSLASRGLNRHDVVSVVAFNIPAMYELQFAVPMAGFILNNINTRLDARTISHSESKLVFVDHQCRSLLLEAISLFPPNSQPPNLVLISDDDDVASPESEWDPMALNYTSGTTSSPKGVVHCHRGIFIVALIDWAIPKQPVYLWTLPMFHANGWCFTWGMAAVTNICVSKFDAFKTYGLIERHGVTHMCGAPVLPNMLSKSPCTNNRS